MLGLVGNEGISSLYHPQITWSLIPYETPSKETKKASHNHLVAEFPGPQKVYTFYSNENIRTPKV